MEQCTLGKLEGTLREAYRGIKQSDLLFNDEDGLSTFLSLSEQGNFYGKYKVRNNNFLEQLCFAWDVDPDFQGKYIEDYQLINNSFVDIRTSCMEG